MKNILTLLLLLITTQLGFAATNKDYLGMQLADALVNYSRNNPDAKLNFIYDELEHYKVKGRIRSENPAEAIRELVALNPVKVTESTDGIYIEAMQKGKYRYSGRTVSALTGEPVDYASVVLLNPKDSTVVTYGISDGGGYFSIPCDRKDVIAKFSSVGYKTLYMSSPSFSMGNVRLNQSAVKLNQITATAESQYALRDRLVFIPSGREKKAAIGGVDLLRFMAIPSIMVNPMDKSVTTISGDGVALFIDNVKASEEDVKNMRPENVKKVEVLDYPADPRFEGVPHAINFVMVKYEYGGYTKLAGRESMEFRNGSYAVSSRFTYKKITYDIYTGYDHQSSNKDYANQESSYNFTDGIITSTKENLLTDSRQQVGYVTARVNYVSDKAMISNKVSLRKELSPGTTQSYLNTYAPPIYPAGVSENLRSGSSLSPSWGGNYQLTLPKSFSMIITPSATYSRNHSNTHFSEDGITNISNVTEDAWRASIGVGLSKSWGRNSVTLSVNGELADNKLDYRGSNPDNIHYFYEAIGAFVRGSFNFGILQLQPSAKFFFSKTKFGSEKYYQPLPGYYISGSLNFSHKHQLGFSSEMSNWTVGAAQRSPNIVVYDLLNAVKGNPSLKTWLYNSANINYTWLPTQTLNISAYGSYTRHTKPLRYVYTPTDINGREMMLRSAVKDGYFQIIKGGVSGTYRLLDNSLVFNGGAGISGYRIGGMQRYGLTAAEYYLSAVYYFKNFYFNGYYSSNKKLANENTRRISTPSFYGVCAGWSKFGLNVDVQFDNFFRSTYHYGYTLMSHNNFSSRADQFSLGYHRRAWLNIAYTFSYGKKVREERLDKGSSVSSGIVR